MRASTLHDGSWNVRQLGSGVAASVVCAAALALSACAVSPDVTPLPNVDASNPTIDARPGSPDAQPGLPDARPDSDAQVGGPDAQAGDPDGGVPFDAPPPPLLLGWPDVIGTLNTFLPAGNMVLFKLPRLPNNAALEAWGITTRAGNTFSGNIKMALYSDRAGQPGVLVNWTGEWNPNDREYAGTGALLMAGEYWLAVQNQNDETLTQVEGQLVARCSMPLGFNNDPPDDLQALPTPPACGTDPPFNIYIRVREQ
ncbi:hypothetical protein [Haliangium sp.]|uniref:hypothetical protein n=1 Tax=Haliangium sp. TaxID=2663208 RepID=UPI003D13C81F